MLIVSLYQVILWSALNALYADTFSKVNLSRDGSLDSIMLAVMNVPSVKGNSMFMTAQNRSLLFRRRRGKGV